MTPSTRSIVVALCAVMSAPVLAHGAVQRPTDDVHTRTIALNLAQSRSARNQESRDRLLNMALEAAVEGMAASPTNPKVWFLAGQVHVAAAINAEPERALELYRVADDAFTRAVELYPDYEAEVTTERSNAWTQAYNAAVTAQSQGNLDLATLHFERADAIYRGRPEARFYLGQLYLNRGDVERSIEAYRGALELLAAAPPPGGRRGGAGGGMNPAERAEMMRAAAFNLAQILTSERRHEEAAELYRSLLDAEPNNLPARINLALVLSELGRHEEAAELYATLLSRRDLSAEELFSIGIGLFQASMYGEAARAFGAAAEMNPYMREALRNQIRAAYQHATMLLPSWAESDGASRETAAQQLRDALTTLLAASEGLHVLEPRDRMPLAMREMAYRSLADLTDDATEADSLRARSQAAVEELESWPFEVTNVRSTVAGRSATVAGQIENRALPPGAVAVLHFRFVGANGAALGTRDVTVEVAGPGTSAPFEVAFEANAPLIGWMYDVEDPAR